MKIWVVISTSSFNDGENSYEEIVAVYTSKEQAEVHIRAAMAWWEENKEEVYKKYRHHKKVPSNPYVLKAKTPYDFQIVETMMFRHVDEYLEQQGQ